MSSSLYCVALLCLAAGCYARMAYQLPAGADSLVPSLQTTFDCEGRIYGYYADVDNACQIFHVCVPIYDGEDNLLETAHFSFLCGNQTVFNQESLTCDHPEYAFPCADAPSLYDVVNSEFGKIPDQKK